MSNSSSDSLILQLNALLPEIEDHLAKRATTVRWSDIDEPDAWLADHGERVRYIVTAGDVGCDNALMDTLPAIELIAINGVGFDKVDLDHARSRNVRVTNTPDVLTDDVADLAVGLLIARLRELPAADAHVRAGLWPAGTRPLAQRVSGRTFGILGMGRIGSAIATRLAGFGAVAYTATAEKDVPYTYYDSPQALARAVDVLIVAAAATPATHNLVNAQVLAALGEAGYLVNIARGSVVDELALIDALANNTIAGAALDVFAEEPQVPEALRQSDKVVLAPHIGSATWQTRRAMGDLLLDNLDAHIAGKSLVTPVC
ncbi:MAG: 2-hydroxyacid dehydrogenase [Salinisphaera sp.]|jgi:lactate dehydrogenase-like 2-hydroxyacid dehydrogenase|nr:2-hydroxyacid dehydrogenase [Salinisphaera sp.]